MIDTPMNGRNGTVVAGVDGIVSSLVAPDKAQMLAKTLAWLISQSMGTYGYSCHVRRDEVTGVWEGPFW